MLRNIATDVLIILGISLFVKGDKKPNAILAFGAWNAMSRRSNVSTTTFLIPPVELRVKPRLVKDLNVSLGITCVLKLDVLKVDGRSAANRKERRSHVVEPRHSRFLVQVADDAGGYRVGTKTYCGTVDLGVRFGS